LPPLRPPTVPNSGNSTRLLAPTTTFRVNAGGAAFAASGGRQFAADAFFAGGRNTAAVSGDVLNTTDDALYHNGRSGETFSYNLPTGNGTFDVTLHFNETWWGNGRAGGPVPASST
jgi:hypothetical protein